MKPGPFFYRAAIAAASALSGGVAFYLHQVKLRPPEPVDPFSTCLVSGGCATVQQSAYGWFLGYDVALIGAVGYAAILAVSLFGLLREWRLRREPTVVLMALIYPAVLFTAWLKYAEFIVLRAFCPWCAVSTVTILLCAILVTLDWRRLGRADSPSDVEPMNLSAREAGLDREGPASRSRGAVDNLTILLALALLGGALGACDVTSDRPAAMGDASLDPNRIAGDFGYHGITFDPPIPRPDFVLTDTNGQPYDFRAETEGKVALLFIGYTSCPDVCPLHMANIATALGEHPELEDRVEVVFITADPERDTPERLRTWLGAFNPNFVGLRGTPEEVHEIETSLNLPLSVVPTDEGAEYSVGHAALVVAFSPDGQGHIGYASGAVASDYAEDLPRLLAAPSGGI